MEAHGAFATSMNIARLQISAATLLSDETVSDLQEKLVTLGLAATRTHLWGPEAAVSKANDLARAALRRFDALKHLAAAQNATTSSAASAHHRQYGDAGDEEKTARADFVAVARTTLAAAP